MGGAGTDHIWRQSLYVIKGCFQGVRVCIQHHNIFQRFLSDSLQETNMRCHSEPHTEAGLSNWREREPPPPAPALGCFSIYLCETAMDSYEVGHGCAVERGHRLKRQMHISTMHALCSLGYFGTS